MNRYTKEYLMNRPDTSHYTYGFRLNAADRDKLEQLTVVTGRRASEVLRMLLRSAVLPDKRVFLFTPTDGHHMDDAL